LCLRCHSRAIGRTESPGGFARYIRTPLTRCRRAGDSLWFGSADVGPFHNRTQCPLFSYGVLTDELLRTYQYTTIVLGPRFIRCHVYQDMTNPFRPQFIRCRRTSHEGVNISFAKEPDIFSMRPYNPINVSLRMEPHIGRNHGYE
jgi:hypothetical protein